MTSELAAIIGNTQEKFRLAPGAARAQFKSSSVLGTGLCSNAKIRDHELTVDEPAELGGTDKGPNPVELILAALGTCQEITYRAYATALGIPLDGVRVELTGEIDLRGFFGVDNSVRPGYDRIHGTVHIDSPASAEQIESLRQAVNAHCPVLDNISNPVAVELSLEHTSTVATAAE